VPADQLLAIGAAAGLPCDAVLALDSLHPSNHPGFQLRVTVADDRVIAADPQVGLMHRSAEKLFESRDLRQAMLLADRHDWLAPFTSEVVMALALEDALGIVPPERATWTRMLLLEVERIRATLPFLASVSGAARESLAATGMQITRAWESVTGARMHPGFARIGGVATAVDAADRALLRDVVNLVDEFAAALRPVIEAETARLGGLAALTRVQAEGFGLGGPVGRASGVPLDLRRDAPYLAYAELTPLLEAPVHVEGDARARYLVLLEQVTVSVGLARDALARLEDLGDGPIDVILPKVVRLPEGTTYASIEGPLGISGCLAVGAGDKFPTRMKIRSASFATMSAMGTALVGTPLPLLADAVMSLPVVIGDVDR